MTNPGWGLRRRRGPQPLSGDAQTLAELDVRALTIERQSKRIAQLLDERDSLRERLEVSEVGRVQAEQVAQLARRRVIEAEWGATLRRLDAETPNVTPEPTYRAPLQDTVPAGVDPDELAAKLAATGDAQPTTNAATCAHPFREVNGAGVVRCAGCGVVLGQLLDEQREQDRDLTPEEHARNRAIQERESSRQAEQRGDGG